MFVEVKAFAGYSSQFSLLQTPVQMIRYMRNCIVSNGALEKRKPFKVISGPAIGIISGHKEFKFGSATRGVLCKQQAAPYEWYTLTGAALATATNKGANSGSPTDSPQLAWYNNVLYAVDGTVLPKKLCTVSAGTLTWTTQGLDSSLCTATLAVGVAVTSAASYQYGYYNYCFTMVQTLDQGVLESNNGGEYAYLVNPGVTNCASLARAGAFATIPPGLSAVRIYRQDHAIGQTEFYFVAEVPTTTGIFAFEDNVGAGVKYPQDFTRPRPGTHRRNTAALTTIAMHKNRMFAGAGNSLYFSDVGFPDYMPAANVIKVGTADDIITGLYSFPNYLVIIKQRSIWVLEGSSYADFNLRPILSQGCISVRGSFLHENILYWINESGIWRWAIGSVQPDNIANQIWQDFATLDPSTLVTAAIGHDPKNNQLYFGLKTNAFYVFDPDPSVGRFVGVFDVNSPPASFATVGNYSYKPRLSCFFENGNLASYEEDSGVSGTAETTVTFEAATGMVFPADYHSVEKILKTVFLYDRLGLTVTSSDEQTVTLQLNEAALGYKSLGTHQLNGTSVTQKGDFGGKKFFAAGLVISGSALAFTPEWGITGFTLEYERHGIIRERTSSAGSR